MALFSYYMIDSTMARATACSRRRHVTRHRLPGRSRSADYCRDAAVDAGIERALISRFRRIRGIGAFLWHAGRSADGDDAYWRRPHIPAC